MSGPYVDIIDSKNGNRFNIESDGFYYNEYNGQYLHAMTNFFIK